MPKIQPDLSSLRIFQCAVCQRVMKGRRRIINRMYVWTPTAHGTPLRCAGTEQAAIVTDEKLVDTFAPVSAYPEDDRLFQSLSDPGTQRLVRGLREIGRDESLSPPDRLMGSLQQVLAFYRYDCCRWPPELPQIGFEPACVSIRFEGRADLLGALDRLTNWLANATDEQFQNLVQPKNNSEKENQ